MEDFDLEANKWDTQRLVITPRFVIEARGLNLRTSGCSALAKSIVLAHRRLSPGVEFDLRGHRSIASAKPENWAAYVKRWWSDYQARSQRARDRVLVLAAPRERD